MLGTVVGIKILVSLGWGVVSSTLPAFICDDGEEVCEDLSS